MTDSTAQALTEVEAVLRARCGLAPSEAQRAGIHRNIREILAGEDPARWGALLEAEDELFDRVIAAATVGETYFFREPEHFAFIRDEFLPTVLRRRPGHRVRAWSAGCATGEEAYSLAAVFKEAGISADILATDISRTALAKAKAGLYGRWSLRGEGARRMENYLRPAGKNAFAVAHLKDRIRFAYLNLAADTPDPLVPDGGMDVIFCRNVLIYLDPAAIRRVARRLHNALADGGILITGPSDPLLSDLAPYACEIVRGNVIHRKGGARAPAPERPPEPEPPVLPEPYAPVLEVHIPDPPHIMDAAATLAEIRALANRGLGAEAETLAAAAAKDHPASHEIAYLRAILLMSLGRLAEAGDVLKRLVYIDPGLAVAHFTLGNLRLRTGDLAGARRAFRTAHKLAAARPADETPPLSEGDTAGRLAAAAARLANADVTPPARSAGR